MSAGAGAFAGRTDLRLSYVRRTFVRIHLHRSRRQHGGIKCARRHRDSLGSPLPHQRMFAHEDTSVGESQQRSQRECPVDICERQKAMRPMVEWLTRSARVPSKGALCDVGFPILEISKEGQGTACQLDSHPRDDSRAGGPIKGKPDHTAQS